MRGLSCCSLQANELRNHGAVAAVLEYHLHPVVDASGQRVGAPYIGHHARPLVELDQGDDVRHTRREGGHRRAPDDGEAVNAARALALDPFELVRPANGTQTTGHEMQMPAGITPADQQPTLTRGGPVR